MTNFKIHFAAKYALIEILKQANEFEINKRDDNGRTPLHYAALRGHLNALKVILSIGYINYFSK
jgi:ankyrin repeat protein